MSCSSLLEVCVESVDGMLAAQSAGADRIELCAALSEGGITPGIGQFREAMAHATVPVHAMVRPRGGDFVYSESEFSAMLHDVSAFAKAGGIVSGFLNCDGTVDEERTRSLVAACGPGRLTFHRAFDMTRDPFEALETLVACGVARILTSGGAPTAADGAQTLRALHEAAAGRITLIAAGGIRAHNIRALAAATGLTEFHCGPLRRIDSPMCHRNLSLSMGNGSPATEYQRRETDAGAVRDIVRALR